MRSLVQIRPTPLSLAASDGTALPTPREETRLNTTRPGCVSGGNRTCARAAKRFWGVAASARWPTPSRTGRQGKRDVSIADTRSRSEYEPLVPRSGTHHAVVRVPDISLARTPCHGAFPPFGRVDCLKEHLMRLGNMPAVAHPSLGFRLDSAQRCRPTRISHTYESLPHRSVRPVQVKYGTPHQPSANES